MNISWICLPALLNTRTFVLLVFTFRNQSLQYFCSLSMLVCSPLADVDKNLSHCMDVKYGVVLIQLQQDLEMKQ
jgi:hypothetical protein